MEFKDWNANYFGSDATNPKGDCFIRAMCLCTFYGYKHICDLLGLEFIMGSGYGHKASDGVTVEMADNFAKKTGIIKRITQDGYFLEDDVVLDYMENMLQFDLENIGLKAKTFLVICKDSTNGNMHATAFYKKGGELVHVDVKSCENSIYSIPVAVFAVPVDKICKKDDPNYYSTERARILRQWAEDGYSRLKKMKKDK
jgi:hypothetical protein